MKLPYKIFAHPFFPQVVQKVLRQDLPIKIAYKLKKLGEEIDRASKKVHADYMALVAPFMAQPWDGKDQTSIEWIPNGEALAKEAELVFGETEMTFERGPLFISELSGVQMSAYELSVLGGLLVEDAPAPVTPLHGV
jgi:hypothetical protein